MHLSVIWQTTVKLKGLNNPVSKVKPCTEGISSWVVDLSEQEGVKLWRHYPWDCDIKGKGVA